MMIPNDFAVQLYAVTRQAEREVDYAIPQGENREQLREIIDYYKADRLQPLEATLRHLEILLEGDDEQGRGYLCNLGFDTTCRLVSRIFGYCIVRPRELKAAHEALTRAAQCLRGEVEEAEYFWRTRMKLYGPQRMVLRRFYRESIIRELDNVELYMHHLEKCVPLDERIVKYGVG